MNASTPRFTNLTALLRHYTRGLTGWLGASLARLGLNPNLLTLLGLIPAGIAALLSVDGQFAAAGLVLLIGAPLDALDGAVARASNRTTRFGALLDSTVDRYADSALLGALVLHFAMRDALVETLLALGALTGASLVPYVRARAEGLAIASIRDGWFDRVVRLIVLIAALLTGWVVPGLAVLAVGSHFTAIQRLLIARRATHEDQLQ